MLSPNNIERFLFPFAFALLAAAAVTAVLVCGCAEGPEEPRLFLWEEKATFPAAATVNAVTFNPWVGAYACGARPTNAGGAEAAVIYEYQWIDLTEIYRCPNSPSTLNDIRTGEDFNVWAAGSQRTPGGTTRPLLVRYYNGVVAEEQVPSSVGASSFEKVYCVTEDLFWFQSDDGLYISDHGAWRRVRATTAGGELAVTAKGRAYYLHAEGGGARVAVSDDRGATWTDETLAAPGSGYAVDYGRSVVIAAAGEGLYAGVTISPAGAREAACAAILGRDDAPPGQGTYDVAFIAPGTAAASDFTVLSFNSRDDGFALGDGVSVRLRFSEWRWEYVPPGLNMEFTAGAVSVGYWWAVGSCVHVPGGRLSALFCRDLVTMD